MTRSGSGDRFEVRYIYKLEGREYAGSRYRTNPWSSDQPAHFEELKASLPEGSTVHARPARSRRSSYDPWLT